MSESTLSLTFADLKAEVGLFLGFGRGKAYGESDWTKPQTAAIESAVKSGLRQFYFPPALEGEKSAHDWSFLRPTATLTLPLGATQIPLPDDYGSFEGEITLQSSVGVTWDTIRLYNEGSVREAYMATPLMTGRPTMAAVVPLKGTTPTQGQRMELLVFPKADQAYTLQFEYYLLPDALTGALPYTYGGAAHAETILESCKAMAELALDDLVGPHQAKFMERLIASVSQDRRNKPQVLGYNGDRSDNRATRFRALHGWSPVTYNGTLYS